MRTRFAPSPTGWLHLGHVVNAIYVWGLARRAAGEVVLRVEDHDRQRSRPEYERGLLDDLDWLGFRADIYPTEAYRRGACRGRQSDRDDLYRGALAPLVAEGLVFACDCSRKQLEGGACRAECRTRGLPLGAGVGWRVRLTVHDQRAAPDDLLIRDRLGNWTYQWCVVVDDWDQAITHVIRGEDLRDSTERQIALAARLGRVTPATFVHHPLIMKTATQKVSKSDGDTGLVELRAAGWTAADVIGQAAHAVGLQPQPRPVAAAEVTQFFEMAP